MFKIIYFSCDGRCEECEVGPECAKGLVVTQDQKEEVCSVNCEECDFYKYIKVVEKTYEEQYIQYECLFDLV